MHGTMNIKKNTCVGIYKLFNYCWGHTSKGIILYPMQMSNHCPLSSSSQPGHYKDLSHIMGRKTPNSASGIISLPLQELHTFLTR